MAYTFKHGDRPLDGYVIQRGVGRGGFGEVYYAVSDGGKEVALKYLRDNPAVELRGVAHCVNLKCPHLVSIFDVKQNAEGEYFIVMEYVSGPSLRDLLIAEPHGLGAQKAAYFVRELGKGLAYLHDRGIVHRDLKPGNIFYEDGYVKIGDYGLSKFISVSRHSAQTASVGTVHYMAPEVGSGSYQRGIDIYALGVILYEMLLGRVPFEGASMGEVLMKHLTAQPEVDQLPQPFPDVIRKALAKDPNDRYQTVDEMVEAIFDVDDVKQSVVGFDPVSLASAVRRGAGDLSVSPVPSPNPTPRRVPGPPPLPAGYAGRTDALSKDVAKRTARISDKVDRKLSKLQGRQRGNAAAPPPPPVRAANPMIDRSHRNQRLLVSLFMSAGIAVGLGLLVGATTGIEEVGASAGLMVVAMSGGVGLAHWLRSRMHALHDLAWADKALLAGCCGLPMLLAVMPMIDRRDEMGIAVLIAMLVTALVVDWQKRIEHGAAGELKLGEAFAAGLAGLIFTAIASGIAGEEPEHVLLMGAGVAAASSLVVQVFSCVRLASASSTESHAAVPAAPAPPPPPAAFPLRRDDPAVPAQPAAWSPPPREESSSGGAYPPMAIPIEVPSAGAVVASTSPVRPLRSGVARGFWSIVAFCLLSGAIALALAVMTGAVARRSAPLAIVSAAACLSGVIFSLTKTTLRRREGFWRENLLPFSVCVGLFGLLASTGTVVAMNTVFNSGMSAQTKWLFLTGKVVSILLLAGLFVAARAMRSRPTGAPATHAPNMRPFIIPDSAAGSPTPTAPSDVPAGETPAEAKV